MFYLDQLNITWSFNDALSDVVYWEWRFTSSDGPFVNKRLARIVHDGQPQIEDISLSISGVSKIKPATLLLKNVNQTYDGIYRFGLTGPAGDSSSDVVIFIASKF